MVEKKTVAKKEKKVAEAKPLEKVSKMEEHKPLKKLTKIKQLRC